MRVTPTQDRVLVEFDPFDRYFHDSGLMRPDVALDQPVWGTVLGVGPGRVTSSGALIPTTLRPGDRVLVPWSTGVHCTIGDRSVVFGREYAEGEILAVQD